MLLPARHKTHRMGFALDGKTCYAGLDENTKSGHTFASSQLNCLSLHPLAQDTK